MLLLKIILGVVDVATDFISAFNLLSGQFKLGLYLASRTKEEYDNAPDIDNIGWLVLAIPWLPGLARILFVAVEDPWRGVPRKKLAMRVGGYALALMAWPVFPNLM